MTIQLSYNGEIDRWVLRDPKLNDDLDTSMELQIQVSWQGKDDGWFNYRFVVWHAGEWFECRTQTEYQRHIECIEENEGKKMADLWESYQNQYEVVRDNHPVFNLLKKWEAMMELELFFPSINLRRWEGKPLPAEGVSKMAALRDQERAKFLEDNETDFEKQDIEGRELRNDAWATRMGFTD